MNKRKLIRKLALPAGIIAVVSIITLIAMIPINNARYENHKEDFKKYINTFMEQNKAYIKEIAAKIKSVPVDPVLINELQSEYLVDHQKSDQPKKYLWMSSLNSDFLFGAPTEDFQKMNNAFDRYQNTIKADEYYRDRNDYLTKLINKREEIDFSDFERGERPERNWGNSGWRYYKNYEDGSLIQATSTSFSTPVYDGGGKLIGQLFMKVDDKVNEEKYFNDQRLRRSELYDIVNNLSMTLLVISGIFLWFLLPTWVYTDAQERDVKTPGIWAFLTLTSLFFGLTIYLITRPNTLKSFSCPKCEGELNGTKAYCPHCGYDLANTFCQQCQYPIKPEWQFCPNCRAESKAKQALRVEAVNHSGHDHEAEHN
ncbi:hypothetical protein C0389_05175 [bacterium]|nr:hypothetical protein [bacterium]